jgi:serine/threonine protein kinase
MMRSEFKSPKPSDTSHSSPLSGILNLSPTDLALRIDHPSISQQKSAKLAHTKRMIHQWKQKKLEARKPRKEAERAQLAKARERGNAIAVQEAQQKARFDRNRSRVRQKRYLASRLRLRIVRELDLYKEDRISTGGQAGIYLAQGLDRFITSSTEPVTSQFVVKIGPSSGVHIEKTVLRHLKAAGKSEHENIIKYYETVGLGTKHYSQSFLVLEYGNLGNLKDFILGRQTPVHDGVIWQCLEDISAAVAYLHTGWNKSELLSNDVTRNLTFKRPEWSPIWHADIKPLNILVFQSKDSRGRHSLTFKLADFGMARILTDQRATKTSGGGHATPIYMPAECNVHAAVDLNNFWFAGDVWALGESIHEVCTASVTRNLPKDANGIFIIGKTDFTTCRDYPVRPLNISLPPDQRQNNGTYLSLPSKDVIPARSKMLHTIILWTLAPTILYPGYVPGGTEIQFLTRPSAHEIFLACRKVAKKMDYNFSHIGSIDSCGDIFTTRCQNQRYHLQRISKLRYEQEVLRKNQWEAQRKEMFAPGKPLVLAGEYEARTMRDKSALGDVLYNALDAYRRDNQIPVINFVNHLNNVVEIGQTMRKVQKKFKQRAVETTLKDLEWSSARLLAPASPDILSQDLLTEMDEDEIEDEFQQNAMEVDG